MLRKTMIVLATVLALGSAPLSSTAFARDGGGHDGGGGGHAAGGFHDGHFGGGHGDHMEIRGHKARSGDSHEGRYRFDRPRNDFDAFSDSSCYQIRRDHTSTGWHWRYVYTCE
jgi:hypothetical protein